MKNWFTAVELAGLPGMPTSDRDVRRRAIRFHWRSQTRESAGGRPATEYLLADLPEQTRAHLLAQALKEATPATASAPSAAVIPLPGTAGARLPAAPGALALAGAVDPLPATPLAERVPDPASMTGRQSQRANAAGAVLKMIEQVQRDLGFSLQGALASINRTLAEGANAHLIDLVRRANARPRKGEPVRLFRATVLRWKKLQREGGWAALAPLPTHYERMPEWAGHLLAINHNPAKLNAAHMHELLMARLADPSVGYDGPVPSYRQVNTFLRDKVGAIARQVGRRGPRDLANNVLPYTKRLLPKWPDDIYGADGHTFDARVLHWEPGKAPLRPEITTVISASTRKIVGVSFGESESKHGVLEAQRVAFTTHGVCASWYVDNGPGFKNDEQQHEVLGVAARVGFTIDYANPYMAKSRGFIERSHQSLLIRAAKELPSYVGRDMDKQAAARVYRLTADRAKRVRGGEVLPTWQQFVAHVLRKIDEYNARPHKRLPQVLWPDGVKRHQSPNMAWEAAREAGWTPRLLTAEEGRDLFRPQEIRVVQRGGVLRLWTNEYWHKALAEYAGEKVALGYDWADPSFVTVREFPSNRWICDAGLDAHAAPFQPESALERKRRLRDDGRVKRAQARVDRLTDEIAHGKAIEHAPSPAATFLEDVTPAPEPVPALPERPVFRSKADRYEWVMANRDRWREDDLAFVREFARSETYELLSERWEHLGIAWKEDGEAPFKAAQ